LIAIELLIKFYYALIYIGCRYLHLSIKIILGFTSVRNLVLCCSWLFN